MKIAITGATGYVGRHLVARLTEAGIDVVALGRDRAAMADLGVEVADYYDLPGTFAGASVVVHLAVLNNDAETSEDAFIEVNLTLTQRVVEAAAQAGVPRVIHASTLQVLDDDARSEASPYAKSKRAADQYLATVTTPEIVTLRLAAVYGAQYRGKLALLNCLPAALRRPAFRVLAALRPTAHVDTVAQTVLDVVNDGPPDKMLFVTDRQEGNLVYGVGVRLLDLAFALSVLVLLSWLLILTWVAIKLTSPGPGLFIQDRVGRHGRVFRCFKFRTMAEGTVQAGTHDVSAASVTRVGAIMRRTKIDELPQALNLLRGDMSLVGPRPCLPIQTELVAERQARDVLDIRGGITGLAQVQGVDMSDPERLARLDAEYFARRCLPLDVKIVIKTFLGGGRGDKTGA